MASGCTPQPGRGSGECPASCTPTTPCSPVTSFHNRPLLGFRAGNCTKPPTRDPNHSSACAQDDEHTSPHRGATASASASRFARTPRRSSDDHPECPRRSGLRHRSSAASRIRRRSRRVLIRRGGRGRNAQGIQLLGCIDYGTVECSLGGQYRASPPVLVTYVSSQLIRSKAAIARLRAYKPPPFPLWDRLPVSRRAAVLMLLYADRRGDLRVVITMRAASLRSFSGASLPCCYPLPLD